MKGKKGKKKQTKKRKQLKRNASKSASRSVVAEASKAVRKLVASTPLQTEADVERLVVEDILTGANFLEIPRRHIHGKKYLAPTDLDKAAGKNTGYFPDYSIWEKAFPVMVVEAKAPDVDVAVGFREASLYARHLNQRHKSGLNPCYFIVATNGIELMAGPWDSAPTIRVLVSELLPGTADLDSLRAFCHYRVLAQHAKTCLAQVKPSKATRPFSVAGGQAVLNAKKAFNTFAAELSPILRRYFTSATQNSDADIFKRAYVATDETTSYDRILESLLKERLPARRGPLTQELEPTRTKEPALAAALTEFERARPPEGQLQLITGSVGVGKSLFARRYKEMLQGAQQRERTRWAFIDFNTAPANLDSAQTWLCETFASSFVEENPTFDPYSAENLVRVFSRDLQKRQGVYDQLAAVSKQQADLVRAQDLQKWQDDAQRVAFGICRHFGGDRGESVVVVFDNVDRLGLEPQLAIFQMALWFMSQSQAFVILQMRDETYERFKDRPPLDTFRSGISFHISPPRFIDVVKRRLELSLEYLTANAPEKLEYVLSNGAKIVYPKSRVGQFLKEIYLELFERKRNIARILQGIAGRDVRRALEMFVAILVSGHFSEESITSIAYGGKAFSVQEYTVLRILMRTEYNVFSEKSGFVTNIFNFEEEWESPNNFILSDILFWLIRSRKDRGEIGLEGYFSVERIASELQKRGYIRGDIFAACNELLRKQLIEADHMNFTRVEFTDSVKVSSSGFIHMRILSERIEYVYGILHTTPVFQTGVAQALGQYLQLEARGMAGMHQKVRAVEEFLKYLKFEYQRLCSVHPEFGAVQNGAAYVLSQIESAILHYRSGTTRLGQGNLLDS